jgi:hypothetical protein
MQIGAKVESVDALVTFRVALVKFAESANIAITGAESDVQRTIMWLDNDQTSYWNTQIRHRKEDLARALEALRAKTVFKDSTGRTPSAVEEQKAVTKAQMRLQEAEHKFVATKQWSKRLQKEMLLYKGAMQRFVTSVSSDVPAAANHLGQLVHAIQEYAALNPGAEVSVDPGLAAYFTESGAPGAGSMARTQPAEEGKKEETEKKEAV